MSIRPNGLGRTLYQSGRGPSVGPDFGNAMAADARALRAHRC